MSCPLIPGFSVRPITISDAAAWAAYLCLPEVKQHTSISAVVESDVVQEVARTLTGAADAPLRFGVRSEDSGELLATVGFHSISASHGTAEIAYDVAPWHWGKGIATKCCRAATLWGFRVRGWHRIQGTTLLSNTRSQRVLEGCGFRREGVMRNLRLVRGQPADFWLYSALPEDVGDAGPHE